MAEEKKKGWFQKFKSVVLGGDKEITSLPSDLSQSTITEDKLEQLSPFEEKIEEALVKESLQAEEIKKIKEETVEGGLASPLEVLTPIDIPSPSEDFAFPLKPEPHINIKLEIGKGRIPFVGGEKQENELSPVKNKHGTSELMSELRSQETPLEYEIKEEKPLKESLPAWLPPPLPEPTEEEKKNEINLDVQEEKIEESSPKKSWFTKVINTLNAPIEFKIQTPDGNDSFIAKLKGNVSIGLGKPVIERTDEDIAKWKDQLRERLSLTRESFTARLERLMHGRTKIDEELLEEIEEILLESDVGVDMTDAICKKLRTLAKEKRFLPSEVMPALFDYLKDQLDAESQRIIVDESRLNIIMMVGVNGTGKTTTTGKIAAKLRISDYSVILAAADTFRAAAIDQLDVWSQRAQVPMVKHQENSDAAAVVYDAIKAAQARNTNVLLIDTAGRLHNKSHLMEELRKIRKIIDREAPNAKLEVLLVLDGTTGQNGLKQATVFSEAVKLTGVVLTKLDGTAKGGVIFSIKNTLKLPIKLVGVGEGIEDLRDFEPQIFIDALFSEKSDSLIEESTKIRS